MKKIILVYFLLTTSIIFGQKNTIKGTAINSKINRVPVFVTLNDTINKYDNSSNFNQNKYESLFLNKNYNTWTNKKNQFKIKAKLTDSLTFSSPSQITESHLVSDLISENNIRIKLKTEPCKEYITCEDNQPKLYIFIGKKLNINYGGSDNYCDVISMSTKYNARYKIIENLYGDYQNDTMKFVAYEHGGNGKASFDEYEYVILYVAEYCGKLLKLKYLDNDVYKTKNGKWATPYKKLKYNKLDSAKIKQPEIIEFENDLIFKFGRQADSLWLKRKYPKPYYQIKGVKARAIYGYYVNDILEIMKKTILKSKGFFE
tara:strand:- start:949 stop:1896 length:948 start_codon:yes stop_codon:yes gene_type:complete